MADVFISYAQRSPEPTEALAAQLQARGLECWYDVRLGPTDVFWKVIMQRITEARSVITIWSPAAIESQWVYAETTLAHDQGKLLCVRTEDLDPRRVPLPFNGFNVSPVSDLAKIEEGLRKLGLTPQQPSTVRPEVAPAPHILLPPSGILRRPSEAELQALSVGFDAIKASDDTADFEDLLAEFGGLDHFLVRQAVKRFDALRDGAARQARPGAVPAIVAPAPAASADAAEIAAAADDVILRIEPGMHTAMIKRIAMSADGRLLASGSEDKTVRLWRIGDDGAMTLVCTLRPAIGDGNDGKVYAVALAPDGSWVAAGGWDATWTKQREMFVSIFDVASGEITARLGPLPNAIFDLEVSQDGRRLAAGLGGKNGVRVWEVTPSPREGDPWRLAFEDKDYAGDVYGLAFAQDGRLATTSYDGHLRVYALDGRRLAKAKAPGGERPSGIAVSPDGARLVVGYQDTTRVDVLDARTLALVQTLDTNGINKGSLFSVAWLADGRIAAAGTYDVDGRSPIVVWSGNGHGMRANWLGPADTVMDVVATSAGLAYGSADPALGLLATDGASRCLLGPPMADLRGKRFEHFLVSADGRRVRFGLQVRSGAPHLIDLGGPSLTPSAAPPPDLRQADTKLLAIEGWINTTAPKLKVGTKDFPLPLEQYETARSLAIAPDAKSFILGADWRLRRFDAAGTQIWQRQVPGVVWGVNLARDGRLVIAAYADGTIRWHRADDGTELLACFIHVAWDDDPIGTPRPLGWVLWTPTGHYTCSDGADDLIGWHVNRGPDKAADFHPASRFAAAFRKPDIVLRALDAV